MDEPAYPIISPLPNTNGTLVTPQAEMTFYEALKLIADGKRITKLEWDDKRTYGLLKEGMLQIHKSGEAEETTHPWIINDGDLNGDDFVVLQ